MRRGKDESGKRRGKSQREKVSKRQRNRIRYRERQTFILHYIFILQTERGNEFLSVFFFLMGFPLCML